MDHGLTPIRAIIAYDQPLVRDGTAAYLASFPDIAVVGTTGKGAEALDLVAKHCPIDGATNATSTVTVGVWPVAIAVSPRTGRAYVANSGSNSVTIIVP
jgi:DNA-binding beta-propeller fold protein YncE